MTLSSFSLSFPAVYPHSGIQATFRQQPEDFYVNEVLGFDPCGHGEHQLIHIEKRGQNTHWLAQLIAELSGVSERDVGFCGRKDRHAVTRQWFSVYLPHKPNIDWLQLSSADGDVTVLATGLHQKKLRPGMHLANEFRIGLRQLCNGDKTSLSDEQKQSLSDTFELLGREGVPNYFGEQRFGRGGNNLRQADTWLMGGREPPRKSRSMVLSAARSYIFNQVLALRVKEGNWNTLLSGDASSEINSAATEAWPTGPLWGRGRPTVSEQTLELEARALEDYSEWCERLEHRGLHQERRSLVLMPTQISQQWQGDDWQLRFTLPVGTFATVLLDELVVRVSETL